MAFLKAYRCFQLARACASIHDRRIAVALGRAAAREGGLDERLFDIPAEPEATPACRRDPYSTALRCFSLAARPASPSERVAAIGRGKAIAASHGLDFRLFDIPGEEALPHRGETPLAATLRRMEQALVTTLDAVGAGTSETAYDARRRNFDDACRDANDRDARRRTEGAGDTPGTSGGVDARLL